MQERYIFMLGSDYRELIVPKRDQQGKQYGILIGGILLTVLAAIPVFTAGMFPLLLLSAAIGFGTWYLYTAQNIEYEYVISGDELVITKIINESKRKPMLTVSLMKFTAFGSLKEAPAIANDQTLVLACSAQDGNAFFAEFDHDSLGRTRLLWTPNDDILLYLTKHLPRPLGFRWDAPAQTAAES